jgi:hypothetical protein
MDMDVAPGDPVSRKEKIVGQTPWSASLNLGFIWAGFGPAKEKGRPFPACPSHSN